MVNTIQFDTTDAEITDLQGEEKDVTLEDLEEKWKEIIANLSDEKIQELKQKAIEEENYDIAKLIKIEQNERKEKTKETEEKIKEEEEKHEKIQEKITFSHEENLEKAKELIDELNKEESNESNENKVESELDKLTDEEIQTTMRTTLDIAKWRWRENSHMRSKLAQYPSKEAIPGIRKYMKEHPEEGITDKQTFYETYIKEITDLIKESQKEFAGSINWDVESLEGILNWLKAIGDDMKNSDMEWTKEYENLKKIFNYFNRQKEVIEEYLNLPRRHR